MNSYGNYVRWIPLPFSATQIRFVHSEGDGRIQLNILDKMMDNRPDNILENILRCCRSFPCI